MLPGSLAKRPYTLEGLFQRDTPDILDNIQAANDKGLRAGDPAIQQPAGKHNQLLHKPLSYTRIKKLAQKLFTNMINL